jgi:uncharacterized protein (DUF362 family)
MGAIMITRRKFLKWGVSATAALSAPQFLIGCDKKKAPTEPSNVINAQVAIIRGDGLDAMTRDALDAIGGIAEIVHPGESVFIKPNMVTLPWGQYNNVFLRGECTKPEIVVAVADECLKAGASRVIIGDASHLVTFDWSLAATLDGSTDLVQEAERLNVQYDRPVTLACLENDSPGFVEVPSRTYLSQIAVSSLVTSADRVISIPVAKTHTSAQLTLALKNFIGVAALQRYGTWINNSHWDRGSGFDHSTPATIAQIYLDIVDAIRPDLTVIDFSIGIEGDGPTLGSGGRIVDMKNRLGSWLVLASTDIMAADATAARVMNHRVSQIKQLVMGADMGLGEIGSGAIEIIGEKLSDVRVSWAPARVGGTGHDRAPCLVRPI